MKIINKNYLCLKEIGLLRENVPGPPNPMSNPSAMMDMMKGNMTFMLPNMVMMAFVSYFFAGFVLVKVCYFILFYFLMIYLFNLFVHLDAISYAFKSF